MSSQTQLQNEGSSQNLNTLTQIEETEEENNQSSNQVYNYHIIHGEMFCTNAINKCEVESCEFQKQVLKLCLQHSLKPFKLQVQQKIIQEFNSSLDAFSFCDTQGVGFIKKQDLIKLLRFLQIDIHNKQIDYFFKLYGQKNPQKSKSIDYSSFHQHFGRENFPQNSFLEIKGVKAQQKLQSQNQITFENEKEIAIQTLKNYDINNVFEYKGKVKETINLLQFQSNLKALQCDLDRQILINLFNYLDRYKSGKISFQSYLEFI